MADDRDTLTLTIHGLPAFNKDVDGEVFAQKFLSFMQGLAASDKAANNKRKARYLIAALEKNTATASVREHFRSGPVGSESGLHYYQTALSDIYYNRPDARKLPVAVAGKARDLSKGVGDTFYLGEVKFQNDNVVRIDVGFHRNAERIFNEIKQREEGRVAAFSGQALVSLDGYIKALVSEATSDEAVLVLTAGGREVRCSVARIEEKELRTLWKTRCHVVGVGHYTGNDALPDWVDATRLVPVQSGGDWANWKGAMPGLHVEDWAE